MQEAREPAPTSESSDYTGTKSLWQRIEDKPIQILGTALLSGIGIGWAASENVRVEPRDFEIFRLQALLNAPRSSDAAGANPEILEAKVDARTRLQL